MTSSRLPRRAVSLRPLGAPGEASVPLADRPAPIAPIAVGGPASTAIRLGVALLAYMTGVTLVITLLPFRFAIPPQLHVMMTGTVFDVVANVALFLPLGFLVRLTTPRQRGGVIAVALAGVLLSVAIESAQLFEIERFASPLDVLANGAGAAFGALLHDSVSRRLRINARFIGRLGLELPLMGLVYLLIPLLWLDGLTGGGSVDHLALTAILGLVGASLLASMQRHHFGPSNILTARAMAIGAMVWFVAGALPSLATRPALVLIGMLLMVAVLVLAFGTTDSDALPINRRFEVPALKRAAPLYAFYLVLMAGAPLIDGHAAWSWSVTFASIADGWSRVEILRVLENAAACTVLGFLVAEFRGRREERYAMAMRWVAAVAILTTVVIESLHGFRPAYGASLAEAALLIAACLYGGWLYHLQRAHVRWLLTTDRARS
jgi:glycopeptide antibiotics resistance protein